MFGFACLIWQAWASDQGVLPNRVRSGQTKIYHVAFLVLMRPIPLYTLVKGDTGATENIQSTANSQINLALAAGMNLFQILETSCTPGVRNRDCAPLSQFGH